MCHVGRRRACVAERRRAHVKRSFQFPGSGFQRRNDEPPPLPLLFPFSLCGFRFASECLLSRVSVRKRHNSAASASGGSRS